VPTSDDGRVPSLGHLHEEVIMRLKVVPLFQNVSRRLLDDLVATVGIETAVTAGVPPVIGGREPIVLMVLERPVTIIAVAFALVHLLPGTYLRDHPPFGGSAVERHAWAGSRLVSADDDRSRVFLIDRQTFERLPRIVRHALDFDELKRLRPFFSP
jgi:hypothetical protein